MKNKEFFTVDDHDELVADHSFLSHLSRREKFISELYDLSTSMREDHLEEIEYEDEYLTKFIKARKIYGIALTNVMKNYEPFDVDQFSDTLLTEKHLDDALWAIADDCREWKYRSYFTTFRATYRHGAMQLTKMGRPTTWEKLETAYSKYKTEGRKENLK